MKTLHWILPTGLLLLAASLMLYAAKTDGMHVMTGKQAFSTTATLKPGKAHKITPKDLPKPGATPSGFTPGGRGAVRPPDAMPQAPAGFKVGLYVSEGLTNPRQIRTAPNGDYFVADTSAGDVKIYRGISADGKPEQSSTYVDRTPGSVWDQFLPARAESAMGLPQQHQHVYRFAYKNGDLKATGEPETLISDIPAGGNHSTRDIVFSKDGKSLFVAVGSVEQQRRSGTAEFHRANILEYTPEGKFVGNLRLRNPQPRRAGDQSCDRRAVDAPSTSATPTATTWFPITSPASRRAVSTAGPGSTSAATTIPAHVGKHPELKDKVIVPDVLVQAHSASLGMVFYDGKQFPKEYHGDAFAAEHGSWNHAAGSGHEVIRIPLEKGKSNGVYQDFLTGFSTNGVVWGRPVGVAVATDGSLLVTDDGAKVIWRVSYTGK